ncbi:MAG: HEAT repeat domain-containing protein [Xenococcaceae cyanobacterium MO_207.B15]|nr:HEAT repeat domain-containing protein [Xenococcaceae cyanobacterium MO_207.B15]
MSEYLTIAENINTSADQLRELVAKTSDSEIVAAVARNPNIPIDLLIHLAWDYLHETDKNPALELILVENPNLVEDIYYTYFESASPHFYKPDCYGGGTDSFFLRLPHWFLNNGLKHPDENIRSLVAGNINTPEEYLEQLAEDESWQVKTAVAHSPITPAKLLEKLAEDEDEDVRIAVAENTNTPVFVLQRLAIEESEVGEKAENTIAELAS